MSRPTRAVLIRLLAHRRARVVSGHRGVEDALPFYDKRSNTLWDLALEARVHGLISEQDFAATKHPMSRASLASVAS